MQSHTVLARLSSSLYLVALALVAVVLLSFLLSLLVAPLGIWFENSGVLRMLVLSLLYIGVPLVALFVLLGRASRCPNCGAPYLTIAWNTDLVSRSRELRQGFALIHSHIRVAGTGKHACPKCGRNWHYAA